MTLPDKSLTSSPGERMATLVATLEGYQFLAAYSLTPYSREQLAEVPLSPRWHLCGDLKQSNFCSKICTPLLSQALQDNRGSGRPTILRCPVGLLGFVIHLPPPFDLYCLVGGGVREESLDLLFLPTVSNTAGADPFAILDEMERLPVATSQEVEETAYKVLRIVSSRTSTESDAVFAKKTMERLRILTGIASDIDRAGIPAEAVALLCETMDVLFGLPAITAAIKDEKGTWLPLSGRWGMCGEMGTGAAERLWDLFPPEPTAPIVLTGSICEEIFPTSKSSHVTCFPLAIKGGLLGVMAIFDADLHPRDALLVELLTGKAAMKIAALKNEGKHQRESLLSVRLLEMVSSLALTEGRADLCASILKMASEIVEASCGSLMLIDEESQSLHIESVLGMNQHLAKSLTIQLGAGIAGNVAKSGNPMLVNDIESDERINGQSRTRFKTRSFISLPIKFRDHTQGVLNLSDKKNQANFTCSDLEILTLFVAYAAAMLQHVCSLEKTAFLEKLSVTDPLTDLFNRRFLERRMEEELSRSKRHDLQLTVMLIDLDNFKNYNDICGHVAGDTALKTISRILTASVREMDIVTRFGGEEFCILLPETSKIEAVIVAERIKEDIERELFSGEEGLPGGRLTASIGLSAYPQDGSSAGTLIKTADIALYQAKNDGRNRIALFTGKLPDSSLEKVEKLISISSRGRQTRHDR